MNKSTNLNVLFKPCCYNCGNIAVDVNSNSLLDDVNRKYTFTRVSCEHMGVCKYYDDDSGEVLL